MDQYHRQYLFASEPFGCRQCGIPEGAHGYRYDKTTGVHQWVRPTNRQILNRMRIRRAKLGAFRWR